MPQQGGAENLVGTMKNLAAIVRDETSLDLAQ